MSRLFALALRNARRNHGRSAIAIVSILVGVCGIVFLQAFVAGFIKSLIEDAVLAKIGAIQIHRTGYLDAEQDPLRFDLPTSPEFVARLRGVAGVRAVSPRIEFEATLGNGSISAMVVVTAIDPTNEYEVCPRRRQHVEKPGEPLSPAAGNRVLIGQALSDGLGVNLGKTLIIASSTQAGVPNALDVDVQGLLPIRDLLESKAGVMMTVSQAQALLRMPGRATEYVVDVADLQQADAVAARLRVVLGADYQVHTWRDRQQIRDAIDRMGIVMFFIGLILAILAGSAIVNTVLMSVYERVREIGTMLALGVRRYEILVLFLIESAVLGVVGSTVGAAAGLALMQIGAGGLRFPASSVSGVLIIYPQASPSFLAWAVATATLGTILAALYPARTAARMTPVDALRSG